LEAVEVGIAVRGSPAFAAVEEVGGFALTILVVWGDTFGDGSSDEADG
jgi:hypothetical protein